MGLYEGLKDALKIAQKVDNVDLYKKMLDVQVGALELSEKVAAQQEEIIRLRTRNAELEAMISQKGKIIKYHELYFDADEKGEASGYAYCSRCYEVDKRLVHISQNPIKRSMSTCPQCHSNYNWWGRANKNA